MNEQVRVEKYAPLLLIVAAVLLTFWPVVQFNFISLDDENTTLQNPLMNPPTLHSVVAWWTRGNLDLYDPVTAMARAGVALVARGPKDSWTGYSLNPRIYHAANLLLHVAASLVAFQLLQLVGIRRWPACGGALFFALHPVQVEPVAWITSIKDMLYCLLALLAIWRYLTSGPPRLRSWRYLAATLPYMLATLAKPTAVVAPLIVLILVRMQRPRIPATVWRGMIVWLLLAAPVMIATKVVQPARYGSVISVWQRPLVAADALAFYLYKIVWPVSLGIDYGRSPQAIIANGAIWWTWIVPAAIGGLLWVFRKRCAPLAAGACIFVAGVLPVLGFVRFNFQYYTTVCDRYLYLSMFGAALIVGWTLDRLPGRRGVWAAVPLAALATISSHQVGFWRDSYSLFNHSREVNPRSALVYQCLACAYAADHDYERAEGEARRALELSSDRCEPYVILAEALASQGRDADAIAVFRQGFAADRYTAPGVNNFVTHLLRQGEFDQSAIYARLAIELAPRQASPHINLADALVAQGDWAGALRELQRAVEIDPNDMKAQHNLGVVLAHQGRREEAIAHYQAALRIDPNAPDARSEIERLQHLPPQTRAAHP